MYRRHSNGLEGDSNRPRSNGGNDRRSVDGVERTASKSEDVSHQRRSHHSGHHHGGHRGSHRYHKQETSNDDSHRSRRESHRRREHSCERSGSDSSRRSRERDRSRIGSRSGRTSRSRNGNVHVPSLRRDSSCDSSDVTTRRHDTTCSRPSTSARNSSPKSTAIQHRRKSPKGCYRVVVERLSRTKIRKHQCSKRRHRKNASDDSDSSSSGSESESESDSSSSSMTSSTSENDVPSSDVAETSLLSYLFKVSNQVVLPTKVVSPSLKRRHSDVKEFDDASKCKREHNVNVLEKATRHFSNVFSDIYTEPLDDEVDSDCYQCEPDVKRVKIERVGDQAKRHVIHESGMSKEMATLISSDSEDDPVVKRSGLPFRRDREILLPDRVAQLKNQNMSPKPSPNKIPTAIVKPIPRTPKFCTEALAMATEKSHERTSVAELVESMEPLPKVKRVVTPVSELSIAEVSRSAPVALTFNDVMEKDVDVSTRSVLVVKTERHDSDYGDLNDVVVKNDVVLKNDVVIKNDVIIIDPDDSDLPDLLPEPELERKNEPTPLRPIKYSDCLQAPPLHGHYDVINRTVVPARERVHFTYNQCLSIEGCLEETSDQKFLAHALWWLDYGLVERELPTKFTRRIAKEVLLASQSHELSFRTHASLLRALKLHPPINKIAYSGEYVGGVLSHLGSETDPQTLLNYGLTLDYLVQAFQSELFTHKLLNKRDLKRAVVQNDIGTESSESHRDLKYIFRKLNILPSLTQLSQESGGHQSLYLSPRLVFSQISRLLEMVIVSSPKTSDSVDRICESLVNFTKVQTEQVENIVFDNLTSPLLTVRFLEVYQNWHRINDVVGSTKTSLNTKTLSRVCLYLEAQVLVAKGDLASSLPERLMAKRFCQSGQPIRTLLTFGRRHLEKIIERVEVALTNRPELRPYLMRLDILVESIFE